MSQLVLHAPFDGWLRPLQEVPDAVFAGRMLGDGLAIDPLGDTLHAPADGTVVSVHRAGHAITLALAFGVELLLHFGLETVRLGGEGFAPLVGAGAVIRRGDPLIRVDMNAVAGRTRSLVTLMVLTDMGSCFLLRPGKSGAVKLGEPMLFLSVGGESHSVQEVGPVAGLPSAASAVVRVPLAHGLHARPSARLAELARGFDADVWLVAGEQSARLRSPTGVLALGIGLGDSIIVQANGPQAQDAVAAIVATIAEGMGEYAPFPLETVAVAQLPARVADAGPAAVTAGTVLVGVCAAPGLAVGEGWILRQPEPAIPESADDPAAQASLFDAARSRLRADKGASIVGHASAADAILAAHLAMIDDEDIVADVHDRIRAGDSAGHAWRQVMWSRASLLADSPDRRFAERSNDLLDLELQLQFQIAGRAMPALEVPKGAIVLADDLLPSQVAGFDVAYVAGIATARGGPTSHVAIIAASKGIPALVAIGGNLTAVTPGTTLALDAGAGRIVVAPDVDELNRALAERDRQAALRTAARAAAGMEGRTLDGARIEIFANLGNQTEVAPALEQGAEGCGLLRTEFLFLDRASAPDEDEQAAEYAAIARKLEGRPLIVRLLDIGGDKPAPYLPIAPEENPALGMRGIRVGLAHPDVLRRQMRAILRSGGAGDVRVMAPMIASVGELRAVRDIMDAEAAVLGVVNKMPLGVMVETPAAAIMADRLAAECDFLSIGTNDLTQYVLAMDRGNSAVAGNLDGLDPAVLRMIDRCCQGGGALGKWVGVCGGLASDPLAVPILLGLGVTELSTAPAMAAQVKAVVRAVSLPRCRELAAAVLAVSTVGEVRGLAREMAGEIGL